jgi:hypothetical protein
MSLLGQRSGRIDKNLQRVNKLTKALIAVRAQLLGKADALKLTAENVAQSQITLIDFLEPLAQFLQNKVEGKEEQKLIYQRLDGGGRQPKDWGADFENMAVSLKANTPLTIEQLNKISEVVGYLQGEVAEEVRRLRSR